MTKPSHGGTRVGAGRPNRYGEPTVQVRVPETLVPALKRSLSDYRLHKQMIQIPLAPVAVRPPPATIPRVLTRVSAGFPSPASDELDEGVDLNRLLVRNAEATFFYTVERDADSMLLKGIMGGDRLVVDRSVEPKSGDIVLANIMGEGATVKELQIRGGKIKLIPHSPNPLHKARGFTEGDEMMVIGVVTSCIRQFKS